jgi:hypothetical protein
LGERFDKRVEVVLRVDLLDCARFQHKQFLPKHCCGVARVPKRERDGAPASLDRVYQRGRLSGDTGRESSGRPNCWKRRK